MRILVSGATTTMRRLADTPLGCRYLGRLYVPADGNAIQTGLPFAADNGAFSGFDEAGFLGLLNRLDGLSPVFVAAPDVVADGPQTLAMFAGWGPRIRQRGLPVALVLQDGMDVESIPWGDLDAVFVGGSTAWKLGHAAADIVAEAKRRGMWAHMGRVNSRQRMQYAYEIGCDSFDGTSASMFGDTKIPLYLRWLDEIHRQRSLL
jgi:hypothetical protein